MRGLPQHCATPEAPGDKPDRWCAGAQVRGPRSPARTVIGISGVARRRWCQGGTVERGAAYSRHGPFDVRGSVKRSVIEPHRISPDCHGHSPPRSARGPCFPGLEFKRHNKTAGAVGESAARYVHVCLYVSESPHPRARPVCFPSTLSPSWYVMVGGLRLE